jgi:hypothetical protein
MPPETRPGARLFSWSDAQRAILVGLLVAFAIGSASVALLLRVQAAGADFSCFWAGGRAALTAPHQLYDFDYITGLQGWPLGPGALRPFIYPPSALAVFIPFALMPFWLGYGLWVAATGGVFLAAGLRLKAPWWFILLPPIAQVVYCGQVTFLIGGLTLLGLTLDRRPWLAGLAFGVAAAIKPQLLVLLPVALLAQRNWAALAGAAIAGAAMVIGSLVVFGLQPWLDWVSALGRFQQLILMSPSLRADALTPYAALAGLGLPGPLAFLLIPPVVVLVWRAFARPSPPADRALLLLGGALLVSPYAMNYELALLAPSLAVYLASTRNRAWPGAVAAALAYVLAPPFVGLLAGLSPPAMTSAVRRFEMLRQRPRRVD